ncbi:MULTISPECIES: extensin-like domain-containing protein [unclassified Roseovarius]|uniref:extensin-like domain-containing protein n=1 Tax=unclassified Roseovarius TaxID=2614913 RepID=UPI00273ED438|nr:extensin family protein [Roseovarius sp. MMSF_3350]
MRLAWIFPVFLASCSFGGGDRDDPELVTRGAVCGDPSIQGVVVGDVPGSGACGIANAVEVDAVGGVLLSQPATMNCRTAQTLNAWVKNDMKPIVGDTGGGVVSLKVAAHYVCRTRNHKRGARLSEHSKGNAIDISAFRLRDGTDISVLNDWGTGKRGKILRQLHSSACGPFGTVLGPGSDGYHNDHFHFDTAEHRNGSYCR